MKIRHVLSIAMLGASVLAVVLVLKKPEPVAQPQNRAAIAANTRSLEQKMDYFETAAKQGPIVAGDSYSTGSSSEGIVLESTPHKAEVHLSADEVSAAFHRATKDMGAQKPELDSKLGGGDLAIKDQRLNFVGDLVRGQFLTEVAGKDVWVTVSGHLAARDGYATFDPTEFKLGDLNVPVSLVNSALHQKLAEQRDRLKLPDYVGDLEVENGELVMKQK
ncbi:MAG: hypothetical protein ACLQLC_14715 [Candidatus Sulfotelmatobacter sp.]